jgi:predicted DCC family thiol-disulfide oxidoreductase YuxK
VPVVLFDGVCNLCNRVVRFIVRRDPAAQFRFAALTSDAARRVLDKARAAPLAESIVLVDHSRVFTRSDAVLRIARRLTFPWPLAYALIVVPRPVRDWAYEAIARRRYRWFGRRDVCMVPGPGLRDRFLE